MAGGFATLVETLRLKKTETTITKASTKTSSEKLTALAVRPVSDDKIIRGKTKQIFKNSKFHLSQTQF